MNTQRRLAYSLLAGALAVPITDAGPLPSGLTSPVSTDNFLLRNTADLVSLCSAQPNDPNRIAAIHFCQGFILGIRHYDDVSQAAFKNNLYCQEKRASRDEGTAMFVKWHLANPQYQNEMPLDGVIRWAIATWPCPQPADTSNPPKTPKRSQ